MAEAHSLAAFRFSGETARKDRLLHYRKPQALKAVLTSTKRSWKLRANEKYNHLSKTIYPFKISSLGFWAGFTIALEHYPHAIPGSKTFLAIYQTNVNVNLFFAQMFLNNCARFHNLASSIQVVNKVYEVGLDAAKKIADPFIAFAISLGEKLGLTSLNTLCKASSVLTSWIIASLFFKYLLRKILTYEQFIYENPRRGGYSIKTKIWFILLRVFRGQPKLFHCQTALPSLPVPSVKNTVRRYLDSIEPYTDEQEFHEFQDLAREFETGLGPKLQRYLKLKSWLTTNYVSDWWEQYIYLSSRSPLMIKSNYYGIGRVGSTHGHCSSSQTAVAANLVQTLLKWRYSIETENVEPQCVGGVRPICMAQYKRLFNTTRIPLHEKEDEYISYSNFESKHIVVIHNGRYWKVRCYDDFDRMLTGAELQDQFLTIVNDDSKPQPFEDMISVMTASDRTSWHEFRKTYMLGSVVNRKFLDEVESSCFILSLDHNSYDMALENNSASGEGLNKTANACLFGQDGKNIWFDKSFNVIVFANGYWGFNAEHGFADAPVLGMTLEKMIIGELEVGYDAVGNALGRRLLPALEPRRMTIQLTKLASADIEKNFTTVKNLCDDCDMNLFMFDDFGKRTITKELKTSPDSFLQTVLQIAHFLDKSKFVQTYEAAMVRLFRNGRTETIRSCTNEMTTFVRAFVENTKDRTELRKKFDKVAEKHVSLAHEAMLGQGVDRHLFCLYIICYALGLKSQFLEKFSNIKWGLSTSQTPSYQLKECLNLARKSKIVGAGGGFGPVDDDGYGVSYIVLGEDAVFYHVSSCRHSDTTDSKRFSGRIRDALKMLREVLTPVVTPATPAEEPQKKSE